MSERPPLEPLPVDGVLPGLLERLGSEGSLVLTGPPGSGKTTRVPPALLPLAAPRRVLVLSPRRVAARAAARRVAAEQGWTLGKEVGFVVRHQAQVSPGTRLVFLTEGVLLRRLQEDPLLGGVGVVVLDEVHERHLETDLALGLLREVREARPDLFVLAMSATLDPRPLSFFLGDAPVLEAEGRRFPVVVSHLPAPDRRPLALQVAGAVRRALSAPEDDGGHLLVFLPGMAEIQAAGQALAATAAERDLALHALHGSLSDEAQDLALAPSARRKVILATNLAESSLTVPGVTTVVDTGWARRLEQDRRTGLDRLRLRRISRASATQRAGRAGRTAPGRAFRLWTEGEQAALLEREPPEILRVDLAGAVLFLRAWGCADPSRFGWFEAPPEAALVRAEALLGILGALDARGLTPLGRRLATLPLHPRLGRMLLEAHEAGCLRAGAELAALLEVRDVLPTAADAAAREPAPGALEEGSDLLYRRGLVFATRGAARPGVGLDPRSARAARDLANQLERQARDLLGPGPRECPATSDRLLGVLLAGFTDRVAARRAEGRDRYVLWGGRGARLDPTSGARGNPILLVHRLDDDGTRPEALIRLASALPEALLERQGGLSEEEQLAWNEEEGRVLCEKVRRWGDLVISRRPAAVSDRAAAGALLAEVAARDPRLALAPDPAAERLLARVALLAEALPEERLPRSAEALLAEVAEALSGNRLSLAELRREDLVQEILDRLGAAGRSLLDREAPETCAVPSGRRVAIRYALGAAPVLAVKLQELFGLRRGPRIARGRVGLVLHLLSPAGRPVQVTQDLAGFWEEGYAAVRRELRGRYPKHPWPEDPRTALPTARVRPRRR